MREDQSSFVGLPNAAEKFVRECRSALDAYRHSPVDLAWPELHDVLVQAAIRHGSSHKPVLCGWGGAHVFMADGVKELSFFVSSASE